MKLVSKETLIALRRQRNMAQRDLAHAIKKHHSFVSHLESGRNDTCKPETAEAIARWLEVPLAVLFVPNAPTADVGDMQQQERRAA